MKLLSLLIAAITAFAAFAPTTASANPYYGGRTRITYDPCGDRIVWVMSCVGHDYYGRPIHRWVVQSRFRAPIGYGYHHGHAHYRHIAPVYPRFHHHHHGHSRYHSYGSGGHRGGNYGYRSHGGHRSHRRH